MLSTACWLYSAEKILTLNPWLRNCAFRLSQAPIGRGKGHTSRVANGQRKLLSPRTREGVGGTPGESSDGFGKGGRTLFEHVGATTGLSMRVDVAKRLKIIEGFGPQVGKKLEYWCACVSMFQPKAESVRQGG